MVFTAYTLLLSATLHLTFCHPTREDVQLPRVNISNPYEINNLNYYNANTNTDPEAEDSKLFRRTVSNFEKSAGYIDKTVRQVEALIQANSTLPRLTRGEILEIIENITKTDLAAKAKQTVTSTNNGVRDQKAVMLVMPYTPDNIDDGKMQELFTKPPITRIVGDASRPFEVDVKPTSKRRRRPVPQIPQGGFYGEVFPEPLPPEKVPVKNPPKKPINSNVAQKLSVQKQRPPIFTQKPLPTTQKPETTKLELTTEKPRHRQRSTTKPPLTTSTEISVIFNNNPSVEPKQPSQRKRRPSKSPQRHPNHKYPDDSQSFIKQGLQVVDSPKLSSKILVTTEATQKNQNKFTLQTVAPAKPSRPQQFQPAKPFLSDVNLPHDLKVALDELNLGDAFSKNPIQYDPVIIPNSPPLKDNVKDILASIGVFPSTSTTTNMPDISNVADTLTPDMRELLMSFGLIPDPNYKPHKEKEEEHIGIPTADVNAESYVQFKPLPQNGPTRHEMEEFLGRFGLAKSLKSNRSEKALTGSKPEKVLTELPQVNLDVVPEHMRDVLIDLGVAQREGKKIRSGSVQKTSDKSNVDKEKTTTEKQHVFNPMETPYATQEDLEKLNQLLDIIKQLEKLNGTATEEDLSHVDLGNLKELVGSLNNDEFVPLDEQEWAPDPINYDYGLSKNEVKRQEGSSSTTESVVTVTPEITTTTVAATTVVATTTVTTTEEAKTPNIKDLEDSFGGSSNTQTAATLPPPTQAPKTGFYYLLDWNSFLDIDDQKGKRVNLRFQPKVGDPKQFFSISVP